MGRGNPAACACIHLFTSSTCVGPLPVNDLVLPARTVHLHLRESRMGHAALVSGQVLAGTSLSASRRRSALPDPFGTALVSWTCYGCTEAPSLPPGGGVFVSAPEDEDRRQHEVDDQQDQDQRLLAHGLTRCLGIGGGTVGIAKWIVGGDPPFFIARLIALRSWTSGRWL